MSHKRPRHRPRPSSTVHASRAASVRAAKRRLRQDISRRAGRNAELLQKVVDIEPHLRRTCWPPMTYMMIPSVLQGAKDLIRQIEAELLIDPEDELTEALAKLRQLLADFHRVI